jgi:hypothetical protein
MPGVETLANFVKFWKCLKRIRGWMSLGRDRLTDGQKNKQTDTLNTNGKTDSLSDCPCVHRQSDRWTDKQLTDRQFCEWSNTDR